MKEEVAGLLEESERAFGAAELPLAAGEADLDLGYFYVAQGLLIQRGVRPRGHASVVGASTGCASPRRRPLNPGSVGCSIGRPPSLTSPIYGTKPSAPSHDDVRELIAEGQSFLRAARGHSRWKGDGNGGSEHD